MPSIFRFLLYKIKKSKKHIATASTNAACATGNKNRSTNANINKNATAAKRRKKRLGRKMFFNIFRYFKMYRKDTLFSIFKTKKIAYSHIECKVGYFFIKE
jgi:hypothetical protein